MTTVKNDYGNKYYDKIDNCQLWLLLKWLLPHLTTYKLKQIP
jgi:hypothetical protein